jgi:flavin reductase (DIM6/NTAB) family NADH-FMN oxidoreductase RutF
MNAITSLSLTPPMYLVCVDNNSDTLGPMLETRLFGINMLSATQQSISNNFAKKGVDKFQNIDWSSGELGIPLISGALLSIECSVYNVYEGGDHQIVCGLVKGWTSSDTDDGPLLYYRGGYQEFKP